MNSVGNVTLWNHSQKHWKPRECSTSKIMFNLLKKLKNIIHYKM